MSADGQPDRESMPGPSGAGAGDAGGAGEVIRSVGAGGAEGVAPAVAGAPPGSGRAAARAGRQGDDPAERRGGPGALSPLAARVEAVLFASAEALPVDRLARLTGASQAQTRAALAELASHLDAHGHATALAALAGGFQLLTRPEYAEFAAGIAGRRNAPLSRAALETLAVVAFWQPVTRAAVDELRGVHSDGAIATLLERGLITDAGRAEAPGRPHLYVTTKRFLEHFGLGSVDELAAAEGVPQVPRPDARAPGARRLWRSGGAPVRSGADPELGGPTEPGGPPERGGPPEPSDQAGHAAPAEPGGPS